MLYEAAHNGQKRAGNAMDRFVHDIRPWVVVAACMRLLAPCTCACMRHGNGRYALSRSNASLLLCITVLADRIAQRRPERLDMSCVA